MTPVCTSTVLAGNSLEMTGPLSFTDRKSGKWLMYDKDGSSSLNPT